jgi:hypothetical protein
MQEQVEKQMRLIKEHPPASLTWYFQRRIQVQSVQPLNKLAKQILG